MNNVSGQEERGYEIDYNLDELILYESTNKQQINGVYPIVHTVLTGNNDITYLFEHKDILVFLPD